MAERFDCDVMVVGLGPVGAALSALLADQGLSVIAIDKDALVYPLPRAAHFDHEIMRLFQQLGIAETVLDHVRAAPAYEFRTAAGEVLLHIAPRPESLSGWPSNFMFHQPGVENALRARLAASPGVEVRLEHVFEGFIEDAEGVRVTIRGREGVQTVRAGYLIGCDGAWSPVREASGITLEDYQFDEPWLVIDALEGNRKDLPDFNLQICDPARPTTCVLMGPGRRRWEFMLLPGETTEQAMADGFIRDRLAPWNCSDLTIERRAVYRFHGLVAKTWRQGRVLIAGDAAHQTPPFAGQGMCSGLRDAVNIAWKLAAVIQGRASEPLLDTYQLEREPHIRAVIENAIFMGRLVCTTDPKVAAERDAAMLAARAAGEAPGAPNYPDFAEGCLLPASPGAGKIFPQPSARLESGPVRLDDQLGPSAWLISRRPVRAAHGLDGVGLFLVDDRRLEPFRAQVVDWLDRFGVEAVLVRPDRYVFGSGEPESLLRAFTASLAAEPAAVVA